MWHRYHHKRGPLEAVEGEGPASPRSVGLVKVSRRDRLIEYLLFVDDEDGTWWATKADEAPPDTHPEGLPASPAVG